MYKPQLHSHCSDLPASANFQYSCNPRRSNPSYASTQACQPWPHCANHRPPYTLNTPPRIKCSTNLRPFNTFNTFRCKTLNTKP